MPEESLHKVAIVTGAGSGIGRETAALLAQAGYRLVLASRSRANLEATAERVIHQQQNSDRPIEPLIVPLDLSQPDAPQRLVDRTLEHWGRIDALANIAGSAPLQPIERITPQLVRHTLDLNLAAPVLLTAAAWPTFTRQRSGVVVNLSSMSSIDPFPGFQLYGAAKVGLNLFTRCTAQEGRAVGVRAVAIAPGAVETQMLRQNFGQDMISTDKTLPPAVVAAVVRDCITGQRPFELGETIVLQSP